MQKVGGRGVKKESCFPWGNSFKLFCLSLRLSLNAISLCRVSRSSAISSSAISSSTVNNSSAISSAISSRSRTCTLVARLAGFLISITYFVIISTNNKKILKTIIFFFSLKSVQIYNKKLICKLFFEKNFSGVRQKN